MLLKGCTTRLLRVSLAEPALKTSLLCCQTIAILLGWMTRPARLRRAWSAFCKQLRWGLALAVWMAVGAMPAAAQTPVTGVTQLAVGDHHTCVLGSSGGVKCWGGNESGQLGDNTLTHRLTAVDVTGLTTGVAAIAAGGSHTCALTSGGGVKCWGQNSSGQLGDNTTTQRLTAVDVTGLTTGVAAITAGYAYTCALKITGGVKCWGDNAYGQLGDNTTDRRLTAVDVTGLTSGVSVIAAGAYHTCALTSAGGAKCWGNNSNGQLGDNTTAQRLTAVDVSGLTSGVAGLDAGVNHTCARTSSGGGKCWGNNSSGQLGDNTTAQRLTAVNVSGLTNGVSAIAAGGNHACVLTSTGGVKCWGDNSNGQLGDTTTATRLTEVDVSGLTSGVTAIAAGLLHTCALTSAGGVKCWGWNGKGQLGDNTTTQRLTAADVSGLTSGVMAMAAGNYHACALKNTGGLTCWGGNGFGQLGDSTTTQRLTAVDVGGLTSGVAAIAVGSVHTCALTSTGGVKCWGDNRFGQLGDNTRTGRFSAVEVSGLTSGVMAIAAGEYHTCALNSAGGVQCWGDNSYGQLGDNTATLRLTAVDVAGLTSGVAAIAAGQGHTCALTLNGGAKCWGWNGNGQLGDNTTTQRLTAVDVVGLTSNVAAIAAGQAHTCALTSTGGVKCWGVNSDGQLGDGTTTQRLTAVGVSGLNSGLTAVSAGLFHTCALASNGGGKCWGSNQYGQLGDNTTAGRLTAVDVSGLTSGVATLATGLFHTCAVTNAGGAKCWGANESGQRGDGTLTGISPFPVVSVQFAEVPGAPGIGVATPGNTSVSIAFTAPTSNGGATVDTYRVTCTGGFTATGTHSPITVNGLTNGNNYTCTVAAHNSVGWGAESSATGSFTPKGEQSIIFGSAPVVTVGGTGVVSANATSGLSVSFSVIPGNGVCSLSGAVLTGLSTGSCTVYADQAGNSNYLAAPQVTQTIFIGGIPVAVSAGAMSASRWWHTATLLPTGKVLVAGGYNGASLASAELFDPANNRWSTTGALSTARAQHTATLLPNGKVLVVGGVGSGSLVSAELYDPGTHSWSAAGTLVVPRASHTATLLPNGKVLVAGGWSGSAAIGNAELYDPSTNTWSAAGTLTAARYSQTTVLLPSGKVLVMGGSNGGAPLATAEIYDPSVNSWNAASPMSAARQEHSATVLPNGKVLVSGGDGNTGTLNSAELYDPAGGTWSLVAPMLTARSSHTATLLPNGKVMLAAGANSDALSSLELYDPATGSWSVAAVLTESRHSHTATLLPNGALLLAGGYGNAGDTASAELYDVRITNWSAAGSLTTARRWHTATSLPNGKLLVVGGEGSGGTLSTAELHDPTSNAWSAASAMNVTRQYHSATLLPNGKVLVAGGFNGTVYLTGAELYDPLTNTWGPAGALNSARGYHTATLLANGKVLVVGGWNGVRLGSAELYDPATNSWSVAGALATGRSQFATTLLANGKVLAVAGSSNAGDLSSAELYDPVANSWSSAGNLATARSGHTATLLPNGKVMVAGGYGSGYLVSSEMYDPVSNSWTNAGAMVTARYRHSATLLPHGKVLVAGGGNTGYLSSAELFDPATNSWTLTTSFSTARYLHTATLLSNGNVLVSGGYNGGYLTSNLRFDPGQVPDIARQPMLSSVSSAFVVTGNGFRPTTESSGGGANSSATNLPLLQLMRQDNGQLIWVLPQSTSPATDTTVTPSATALSSLAQGHYSLRVFVSGIPSQAHMVSYTPQSSQSISWGPAPNVIVGGTGVVSATATSGLAVAFSLPASSPNCSLSGSTVTGLAVGLCTVYANQSGNANYAAASPIMQSFSVGPGAVTAPSAPINVNITPAPGRVSIGFGVPANNGGAPISSYTASCSAAGQATRTAIGSSSPLVVTGMTGGVAYSCTVTASNGAYTSTPSEAQTAVPAKAVDLTPILTLLLD